jgi:DNA-binding SARP family transcriptional activator/tetratricopeptide (TPR) repeat protein
MNPSSPHHGDLPDAAANTGVTAPRFLLLGTVEVHPDGGPLALGRRRERCLLALLLLEAGRVVGVDRLVDLLWDREPPDSARDTLYTHMSRLRTALDPGRDGRYGIRLHARQSGYLAEVDPDAVDAHRFTALVRAAGGSTEPAVRSAGFRAALALWRGPVMQDSASELLRQRIAATLTEQRLDATELAVDAELRCGRHRELVGELTALTAEHPTREALWAALARALYRCDRQADALAALRQARLRLDADLGIDPGPGLRLLHAQILRADPALRTDPTTARLPAAHHQLPPDIADFTGRDAPLRHLHDLAEQAAAATSTAVPILVVEGMGGLGKSRLAIRFAHQLLRRGLFDEIQLWAQLHGFHAVRPPAEPGAILGNLLRLLGVAAQQLPEDVDSRAALYRDRLGGRRVLVLLDDAASEEQVRPLLPGGPGSLVLITTRRRLTGLDGVHTLPLETFSTEESLDLLARQAGRDRVAAEPAAARRLAQLCGHLPLALALTARHLRGRPHQRLDELVTRLDADSRSGERSPHADAVQAVFDVSYRALPTDHQRVFRLLAVHPGHDVSVPSVAALAAIPSCDAQAVLDDLLDEHLLSHCTGPGYGIHDLIRQYLTEQSQRHDSVLDRHAALTRVVQHYLTWAEHATLLIHPTERRRVRTPPGQPPWPTPAEAIAWAESEYENLIATVHRAAEAPGVDPELAVRLVAALYRPLANRGHSTDRITLNHIAVRVARRIGDQHAEAQSLEDLGALCGQVGLTAESVAYSSRALVVWTDLGDRIGRQACLADLGNTWRQLGDHDKAIEYLRQSLRMSVESGDEQGGASTLNYLGLTHQQVGDHDAAAACLTRSADAYRRVGNRLGEAIALANHGWARQRAGRPREAIDFHARGLAMFHDLEDHYNEAEQHWGIATASHRLGDPDTARTHWHAAIEMLRDIQALDDDEATRLLAQDVPDTPEIIRLNT